MVDTGFEVDFWRLERIICREVDFEEEDATKVWALVLHKASVRKESLTRRRLSRGPQSRGTGRFFFSTYRTHYRCLPVKLRWKSSVFDTSRYGPAWKWQRPKDLFGRPVDSRDLPRKDPPSMMKVDRYRCRQPYRRRIRQGREAPRECILHLAAVSGSRG